MQFNRRTVIGGALAAAAIGVGARSARAAVRPELEDFMIRVMDARWVGTTTTKDPFDPQSQVFRSDVTMTFTAYTDWSFRAKARSTFVANNYTYNVDELMWGFCFAYPGVLGVRIDGTNLIDPNQMPAGSNYGQSIGNLMVYNDSERAGRLVLTGTLLRYLSGDPTVLTLNEAG